MPLLIDRISPLDIFICPTASAFSFPSAMTATTVSVGISPSRRAPFDVSPGHLNVNPNLLSFYIMFAPDKTNLIAPRSTCTCVKASGSKLISRLSNGIHIYERFATKAYKPHRTVERTGPHSPKSITKYDPD